MNSDRRALRGTGLALVLAIAVVVGLGLDVAAVQEPKAEQYVRYLEAPERDEWQKPDEVVRELGLRGGETVVDLGAGSGYFTRRLARAVGADGRIVAADVSQELLAYLAGRAKRDGLANVFVDLVEPENPKLGARTADVVFLCNTYHHLKNRFAYLERLASALRRGGRVAVVDFDKRENVPEGPPLEEKVSRDTVLDEFQRAGFELQREATFLPYQYFLVFRRRATYSEADLVHALDAAFHSRRTSGEKQAAVMEALSHFLIDGVLAEPHTRLASGPPITTYELHADPGGAYSVAVLVFPPHVLTPMHDHQAWVVWGTYLGREREQRFERLGSVDSGAFPELRPVFTKVYPDDGLAWIPEPPADVHVVENLGASVSISVHVHSTDIAKQVRNAYDVSKKLVIPFVQSYEPATEGVSAQKEVE